MNNTQTCPHCGLELSKGEKFCHTCGKPLIVDFENVPETIAFSNNYDETITDLDKDLLDFPNFLSLPEEKRNTLKNVELNQKIAEIDSRINTKQENWDEVGDLLIEKAALYYHNRDLNNASRMFEMAIDNFRSLGNQEKIALIYNDLGLIYEDLGYLDDALNNYENSLEIFKKIDDTENKIRVLNNTGNIYLTLENLEFAYNFYSEALELARERELFFEYRQTSSNLVEVYFGLKNFDRAFKFLTENIQFFRERNDIIGEIIACSKFGKLYFLLGENYFKLADGYIKNAQSLIASIKSKIGEIKVAQLNWENLRVLGLIHLEWNDNEVSKKYFEQSLNAIDTYKLGPKLEEATVLEDLANYHYLNGNDKVALAFYQRVEKVYADRGDDIKNASIKAKIANIFYKIFDSYDTAITYLEQALDIYSQNNYLQESAETYEKLADVYLQIGSNDSAVIHLENALNIYGTINNEEKMVILKERIKQLK